jgi:hypothetical protein
MCCISFMVLQDGKNKFSRNVSYLLTEQRFIYFLILVASINVKQVPAILISKLNGYSDVC